MADDGDTPLIYGLEHAARALAPVTYGDSDVPAFVVGTQGPRNEDNQVHLVKYDEEAEQLDTIVYSHGAEEIWDIATASGASDLITTCHSSAAEGGSRGATVWRLPEEIADSGQDAHQTMPLEKLFELGGKSVDNGVLGTAWHPTATNSLLCVRPSGMLHSVGDCVLLTAVKSKAKLSADNDNHGFLACRWNPHHGATYVATSAGPSLQGWDLRSMESSFVINEAHSGASVRNLDFNPNKQYHMLSCGDDGHVKFWDLRKTDTEPLLDFTVHTHWVYKARFNPFHDQLVVSSSSDCQVALSNAGSISSVLYAHVADDDDDDDDDTTKPQPNGVIKTYEEHEDSVYAVEWSTADPWLFASLSYDGRFILNHVPRETKFAILL